MVKGAASMNPQAGGAPKQAKVGDLEQRDQDIKTEEAEPLKLQDKKGPQAAAAVKAEEQPAVEKEGRSEEKKKEGPEERHPEEKKEEGPEVWEKGPEQTQEAEKGKGKESEEVIKDYKKKEEEHHEKIDYHEAFTDEEEEEEEKRHHAEARLKEEPKRDAEGKVSEEEEQEREALERIARDLPENTLEEGHIFFFYRPKVGNLPTESVDDIQRFHFVMQPTVRKGAASEEKLKCRLIVVGKKKLPSITRHERFFSFVAAVADSVEEITRGMGESGYATSTRGQRSQGAARLVGSGAYSLCTKVRAGGRRRKTSDVRLAYRLELPVEGEEGDCQRELGLDRSGYFVISVKNPVLKDESKAAGLPTAGPKPEYTEEQQHQLQGLRWSGPWEDVSVLDYKGTELLLIGGRNQQLQSSIGPAADHLEALAQRDIEEAQKEKGKDKKEALTAQLQERIGPAPDISPTKDGQWK